MTDQEMLEIAQLMVEYYTDKINTKPFVLQYRFRSQNEREAWYDNGEWLPSWDYETIEYRRKPANEDFYQKTLERTLEEMLSASKLMVEYYQNKISGTPIEVQCCLRTPTFDNNWEDVSCSGWDIVKYKYRKKPKFSDDLEFAIVVDFVANAHKGQLRKGSKLPFVIHPCSVLKIIRSWEISDNTMLKAVLAHDVIEDCEISYDKVEEIIGTEAAIIVKELTFIPNKLRLVSVSKQKAEYLSSFSKRSLQALVIKLADRIDNTMDFYLDNDAYALKYWEKAEVLFYAFYSRKKEIVEAFGERTYKLIEESIKQVEDRIYVKKMA
jgi:myo-inositol-1(or 4)-monophosphatase